MTIGLAELKPGRHAQDRQHRSPLGELHAGRCDQPGARVHRVRLRPVAEPAHHRARRHADGYPAPTSRAPAHGAKESLHSTLPATFLGTTIAANTPGATALKTAPTILFKPPERGPLQWRGSHPAAGHQQPIQRMAGRGCSVQSNNGAGVRRHEDRGRPSLMDEEARSPAGLTQPVWQPREPMLRLV